MYPRLLALLLIAGSLAAAATGASAPSEPPIVSAGAHGLSILVPGQPVSVAAEATAPGPAATGVADGFVFPADGSLVRTGALSSSVSSRASGTAGAQAVSDVLGVTLFNGEVTAESAAARAKATATGADATGSKLVNLVVFGTPVAATPNLRVALGGLGLSGRAGAGRRRARRRRHPQCARGGQRAPRRPHGRSRRPPRGHRDPRRPCGGGRLESGGHDHRDAAGHDDGEAQSGARRAGTEEAAAEAAGGRGCTRTSPAPSSGFRRRTSRRRSRRRATSSPSTRASSFIDTFGAARAGVVWHHGQDIFAPLGTPLLAVADGTIFSVGWNDLGGYRLWLRDRQGNQFYYAHLSAFSPLAVDGNEVKAGAVVGFVGNTGDAQTTPYHLHFEIHPVGLLPLGYDGVVNPMPYLLRLAAAGGHHLRGRPRLGAAGAVERDRAEAGGDPARLDRHLQRERPRPRLAGPRADRPGLPGRQRGSRRRLGARPRRRSTSSCSPAACTCSRPTPRR